MRETERITMRRCSMPALLAAALSAVLLPAAGGCADEPRLKVSFSPDGRMTATLDGRKVLDQPVASEGLMVRFRPAGSKLTLFGYQGEPNNGVTTPTEVKVSTHGTVVLERYPWGLIMRTYRAAPDRIDCAITVTNTSDQVLYELRTAAFVLDLPEDTKAAPVSEATYFGQTVRATAADAISGPLVLPLLAGKDAVVGCSPEAKRPLALRWDGPPRGRRAPRVTHNDPAAQKLADQEASRLAEEQPDAPTVQWTLSVHAGGDKPVWDQRYTSRPIEPGKSDTYTVSLRFGSADDPLAPAADVCKAYADAHPMILNWPDRRPILRNFMGDWLPYHEPIGADGAKPTGVQTPEKLREQILRTADSLIQSMKEADAQGVVIWNVEGSMNPAIKYVGSPDKIAWLCPEMDNVADEFFKRITDAGFKPGVCIRPTTIVTYEGKDGNYHWRHSYPPGTDPAEALGRKIRYARDRWGVKLFYIDTNHAWALPQTDAEKAWWPKRRDGSFEPYRALMNAEQWEGLCRQFPDILLIPEHSYLLCYTATGPYDQMNMGSGAPAGVTPPLVLATWPKAFKFLSSDYPITRQWEKTVAAYAQGDVVATNAPVEDNGQPLTSARDLAKFRKLGPPATLGKMDHEAMLTMAMDPNADRRTRYFAAVAIAQPDHGAAEPTDLAKLLTSDDWLVRKVAIDAVHDANQLVLTDALLEIAAGRSALRLDAAEAFGRIGAPAVPVLKQIACSTDPARRPLTSAAARALVETPGDEAYAALRAVLEDASAHSSARQVVVGAILARAPQADAQAVVTVILGLLNDTQLRVAAANALRDVKDPRVTPTLQAALDAQDKADKPDRYFIQTLERVLPRRPK